MVVNEKKNIFTAQKLHNIYYYNQIYNAIISGR